MLHHFDAGRASPSGSAHGQQHPQQQGQARQQQQQLQCQESAVPSEFSELAGMTAEELHLLLVDERAYRWVQRLGSFSVAPHGDHGSLIGEDFHTPQSVQRMQASGSPVPERLSSGGCQGSDMCMGRCGSWQGA